jgi:hypothetical protein
MAEFTALAGIGSKNHYLMLELQLAPATLAVKAPREALWWEVE